MNRSSERARADRAFPAVPESLVDIRDYLRELAAQARLPERLTEDLVLAVSEAAANAVVHSGSEQVRIEWLLREDRVEVVVQDDGVFRSRVRVPSVDRPGGFGIPLMTALSDELAIVEGTGRRPGTRVRLVKRRQQG
ncbi:MAG TPA: ATP-binding protein [Actinomycetota bacterium]|nr:ATP-binding protein [Actinomycetota bacterium]